MTSKYKKEFFYLFDATEPLIYFCKRYILPFLTKNVYKWQKNT